MIDIENNTIDGKHYWRLTPVYSVSNDGNKVINNNYIRVTARDHETLYAFEENIFDAKNNKFLFKHWYDYISECLREQKYFIIQKILDNRGDRKRVYNKGYLNGEMLTEWYSIDDFEFSKN